jgi:hypothetical protein
MDPVIEDKVRVVEAFLVGARRQVEMGVNARSTEARDLDVFASDDPSGIRDHAGGADHVELAAGRGFFRGGAGCQEWQRQE